MCTLLGLAKPKRGNRIGKGCTKAFQYAYVKSGAVMVFIVVGYCFYTCCAASCHRRRAGPRACARGVPVLHRKNVFTCNCPPPRPERHPPQKYEVMALARVLKKQWAACLLSDRDTPGKRRCACDSPPTSEGGDVKCTHSIRHSLASRDKRRGYVCAANSANRAYHGTTVGERSVKYRPPRARWPTSFGRNNLKHS